MFKWAQFLRNIIYTTGSRELFIKDSTNSVKYLRWSVFQHKTLCVKETKDNETYLKFFQFELVPWHYHKKDPLLIDELGETSLLDKSPYRIKVGFIEGKYLCDKVFFLLPAPIWRKKYLWVFSCHMTILQTFWRSVRGYPKKL